MSLSSELFNKGNHVSKYREEAYYVSSTVAVSIQADNFEKNKK